MMFHDRTALWFHFSSSPTLMYMQPVSFPSLWSKSLKRLFFVAYSGVLTSFPTSLSLSLLFCGREGGEVT